MSAAEKTAPETAILDRIAKLLEMTVENGCTADEAASAAGRVEEILTKYNIDMGRVRMQKTNKANQEDTVTEHRDFDINIPGNRKVEWAQYIQAAVQKITFTNSYMTRTSSGYAVLWIGETADVQVARMLFKWLIDQGWLLVKQDWAKRDKSWRDGWTGKPASYLPWETSWLKGYATGIWEISWKVEKERKASEEKTGLVVYKEGLIDAHMRKTRPYLFVEHKPDPNAKPRKECKYREPKYKHEKVNDEAYSKGIAKGKSMPLYVPEELE